MSADNRAYSEDERRAAVRAWLILGSFDQAGALLGIKSDTISRWRRDLPEWWERTANEIVREIESEHQSGWLRVLGKAVTQIEDRVDNGDTVLTKGVATRVPMSGKDLSAVAVIAQDRLRRIGVGAATPAEAAEKRRKELAELARQDRESQEAENRKLGPLN